MMQVRPGIRGSLPTIAKYLVLAALIYIPVFGYMDNLCLRIWDESRIAVNAIEMYLHGDFIVTHYNGVPDMWNTKPPLLVWFQVLLMNIIGMNELAIRMPSAIAALFTCAALLIFSQHYLKSFWFGFITVLLLITSNGYIGNHIVRTGDYDALLTFFTTLGCLFFFSFIETKKNKFLYLFFLALALGVLTKGIAGLLLCPAFLIYILTQKELKLFLLNKHFYLGLLGFLFLTVGYYLLRDSQNPGYISTVQENEWGGRFLVSQGKQDLTFSFYYDNFIKDRLSDRYLLIPCGFILGLFSRDPRIKKLALFVLIVSLEYFLIISSAQTRLEQYDAPLYPFLALAVAFFINYIFELIRLVSAKQSGAVRVMPALFLYLAFIIPYHDIFKKTYLPQEKFWDLGFYDIGYFLRDATKGKYDLNGKDLVYEGYNAQLLFYTEILRSQGIKTGFKDVMHLKPGNQVVTNQDPIKQYIRDNYLFKEQSLRGAVTGFTITGF